MNRALLSVWRSLGLGLAGELRLRHFRIGAVYAVNGGQYSIFRETECVAAAGEPVVLVVEFRLRVIRSVSWLHWLFQRFCILTTPFWSGMPGFRAKLWMVDHKTKDYLGIYDWRGRGEGQRYVEFLIPILSFFSVGGSVRKEMMVGRELDDYLEKIRLR